MEKLKTALILLFIGISLSSEAYITRQKNNGILGWLFKDITETKMYDPTVSDYHYHLQCENPGFNRCKFNVLTDAHLEVNGVNISREGLENYFSIAETQIEQGTLTGKIITTNGVVINWQATDLQNSTISLYNITEAIALGILPPNYNNQ